MSDTEAASEFLGCLELHHDAWHYRQAEIRAVRGGRGTSSAVVDEEGAAAALSGFEQEDVKDAEKVAEFVELAVQAERERGRKEVLDEKVPLTLSNGNIVHMTVREILAQRERLD